MAALMFVILLIHAPFLLSVWIMDLWQRFGMQLKKAVWIVLGP